jgi:hypothetical protein
MATQRGALRTHSLGLGMYAVIGISSARGRSTYPPAKASHGQVELYESSGGTEGTTLRDTGL